MLHGAEPTSAHDLRLNARQREDEPSVRVAHPLLGKTPLALAVMIALLAVPYATPKLRALRVARAPWESEADVSDKTMPPPIAVPTPTLTLGETALKPSNNDGNVTNALPAEAPPLDQSAVAKAAGTVPVEDPTGHAMDAFYTHLAKTVRGEPGAVTRVLHYGDSLITADYVSGSMRRTMQKRFGDAGHGFILMANPWEFYFHNDVAHSAGAGWNANRITGPLTGDGFYGLGLVTFHGTGGAQATFGTAPSGSYGRKVSRFDLYYLEQPNGGDVQVTVKGRPPERFSTKGDAKASRVHAVDVGDGEASVSVQAVGNGDARFFGVALERDVPGVVYDALGANGARIALLDAMDAQHWADQMALRKPALVVLQFGTNESENNWLDIPTYEKTYGAVLDKVKAAAGGASVIVISPLDRAERTDSGDLRTRRVIPKIVETQRKLALARGCAFWDTFTAMGGAGTMAKWVKLGMGASDLTHPSLGAAEIIAGKFLTALTTGYDAFRTTHADAPPLPPP